MTFYSEDRGIIRKATNADMFCKSLVKCTVHCSQISTFMTFPVGIIY